ncbi:hypothetical protein [Rhodococcus sp. NPDC055024]
MVQLSGRGADHVGDPRYLTSERAVKESGMDWTILRPSSFYQNFDEGFFRDAVLSGSLILPVGEGKESFIDAWDIAEVAVAALTDSRHAGCTYELTGPRAYSLSEAFSLISAAAGREINFADIAPVEFNTGLIASGLPEADVQVLDGYLGLVRDGEAAAVTDTVQHVLGKPARDFESYVAAASWYPTIQHPIDPVNIAE